MGQGIISVSKVLFEKIPEGSEPLKQPQTLAEWHAFMMLPEKYRLLEVKADAVYPLWLITVENEDIPVVEGDLPEVTPIFVREYKDGVHANYLDRIELGSYMDKKRVIWQREEQS